MMTEFYYFILKMTDIIGYYSIDSESLVNREMQELASKNEEKALAIVATPKSCLSSSNREDYGSHVSKQVRGSIVGTSYC
jgi:hypothetical protein